ncbi:ATP-binding protein [Risungbinella massiliensis]|uniref:ATP-binding protein n=1 Tax=Risungbinella massiliensis TaxID=1329796 RepID=UPI0005CC7D66|nr:sensor histidine kinase [Risungbinella massiliensis]
MPKKHYSLRLETRILLSCSFLLAFTLIVLGGTFSVWMDEQVEEQVGKRALYVAQSVASIPDIRRAFHQENPWHTIQPIAEEIRKKTGAEYVVVGNKQGIRFSHPFPDRIGQHMVGGDNYPALNGKPSITKSIGTLGPAIRGKAPIYDAGGNIIGLVSVGFLLEDLEKINNQYLFRIILLSLGIFVIGFIASSYLARRIKKDTLGLEPEHISSLYQQKHTLINTVREGIIMVDNLGKITEINDRALHLIGATEEKIIRGKPIQEILPQTKMPQVLQTGEPQYDQEMSLCGQEVIVNRLPILHDKKVIGVVSSFRPKSEIDELSKKLSQVQQYTEVLRAQTHEFHNTLYTISGLIQLGSTKDALDLIQLEMKDQHRLTSSVLKQIRNPWICAILMGYLNKARELKVDLVLDPESNMLERTKFPKNWLYVTILGNLLLNAMEAVQLLPEGQRHVRVYLEDLEELLILEVEDSGPGIFPSVLPHIFEKQFSTKEAANEQKRGFGLWNVKQAVEELGGSINVDAGKNGGAIFVVQIPLEVSNLDRDYDRRR